MKGTIAQKKALKRDKPSLYAYCEQVWQIRKSHIIAGLPLQYVFFLVCCLQQGCPHPVCSSGKVSELPLWFDSGPSISYLPLPVPDPSRPYGNPNCNECKGFCCGHFMKAKDTLMSQSLPMTPPSITLKEEFDNMKYPPSELVYTDLSKKVMLPIEEVNMWLDHLQTIRENRKKGALKAAETRRKKKVQATVPGKVRTNVVYAMLHTKTSQMNRNNGLAVDRVTPGFISPA